MRLNRLGRFQIAMDTVTNTPETVMQVMGKCIVVRAEMLYHKDAIEYVAYCSMFDKTEHGDRIPEYNFIYSKAEDGTVAVSAERKIKPDFYADNF